MREIRVGVAGWSYPDWEGVVYPSARGRGFDPLSYLVDYFDVVEINSTFYRPPSPRVAMGWARRVAHNPRFLFTAKLWQKFTHQREELTDGDFALFSRGLAPIRQEGRLGCLLIQFPWSFRNNRDNRNYIARLAESFHEYPLVLEVRHGSWNQPEVYRFLAEAGVGFCNVDQPLLSRSLGPSARATGEVGYVRLHGRNYQNWFREDAGRDDRYNYLYSEEELEPWVERILRVAERAPNTFVIANNHFGGKAVTNALQLLSKIVHEKVRVPPSLQAHFPMLAPISLYECRTSPSSS